MGATPKGRLFPLNLDELLECTALLDAVDRGELDRIRVPEQPLDALAQHVVAETACRDWPLDELYAAAAQASSPGDLGLSEFEQVVRLLAEGYTTRRGRRGAYLHYDAVNRVLRARRGARLTAVTNAGVIPDQFDYEVVLLPEEHRVGTLNEDFAFESIPGDIFQLGNSSYRIAKVETGKVYVEDAKGQPPTIPFWLGERPGRSDELSHAVSRLNTQVQAWLADGESECARRLHETLNLPAAAAQQLAQYLAAALAALGALPTEDCVIFERFFDEVGDPHLVIHSPLGSRPVKGRPPLRARFCRKFNRVAGRAPEAGIVLSLGATHSFPLEEVKGYLKSGSAREVLVQALLDAPMFGTRWRWNASIALAVKRMRNGRRNPPQFQRSDSEDLLSVVFPDQLACAENLPGEREIPDHPLVKQTIADCLHITMDVEGLERLLGRIESGEVKVLARDLAGPSPLSNAILNARPYAFLDDGAAEERRTKAVSANPLMDARSAAELGKLDPQAVAQVRAEAWPEIGNAEELHDALVVHGFLTASELAGAGPHPSPLPEGEGDIASPSGRGRAAGAGEGPLAEQLATLQQQRRLASIEPSNGKVLYVAARAAAPEFLALFPNLEPEITPVSTEQSSREDALREILRGRLELLGPVTASELGAPLGLTNSAR